ncbi:MAG: alpha/beta hydrolase [Lachnospiraceae bacterium]|nr:alpha/beta hydrolase [Lachnospiraceae bacterium]
MNISVDGYNINYKITGGGDETVVMLQGWGTTMEMYDSVAATISDRCRFIQLDLPGFGGSDEPKQPWSVADFSDFFCKFLDALDVKRVTLIGHSYGGRMIIDLATRESIPFEIERIVLIDSAGIMPQRSAKQKTRIRMYKMIKKIADVELIYKLFPELIDEWRSRQGSADYRAASPMMRQCLVKAVNEDMTERLPGIRQEVLLIWGDADTATPISDAKKMESLIPNAGLCVLEGCGHYSFLEQPGIFANIMRTYFKDSSLLRSSE